MSVETLWTDRWLYQTLSSDATLSALISGRVYRDVAPPEASGLFLIYSDQSAGGNDAIGVGGVRIYTDLLYQIKAVGQTRSYGTLEAIVKRVDELLHRSRGTVTGGRILACYRQGSLDYPERSGDVEYRHLGGLYRVKTQANSGGGYSYEKLS